MVVVGGSHGVALARRVAVSSEARLGPVGPLPQSRSKLRRTLATPTESGGNHTREPPGPAATIDRILKKIYDFLDGYGAGART